MVCTADEDSSGALANAPYGKRIRIRNPILQKGYRLVILFMQQ